MSVAWADSGSCFDDRRDLAFVPLETQMLVCDPRGHPTAWRALEETFLKQVRLIDVLDGVLLLAERHRQGVDPDRAPVELLDDREQEPPIHQVQSALVDLEQAQRLAGDVAIDPALAPDLGEIPDPLEQAVDDPRGA